MKNPIMHPRMSEEIANSITHGLGALLSIAGLVVLVVFAALHGNAWKVVSCAVYGATLVILYTASTLYHSFYGPKIKRFFNILDHAAIYVLIAGSYTPFALVNLRGNGGWILFGVVWSLAVMGVVFKIFSTGRFEKLSTGLYLAMGWLVVFAAKPMLTFLPNDSLLWLLFGGVAYSLGVVFFANDRKIRFGHAIWHLFVLAGSVCHFFAIWTSVI